MSMLANVARRSLVGLRTRVAAPSVAVRGLSTESEAPQYTKDGALIVEDAAFTLEWVLSSPPPLHCFEEPPIMVEWPEGEDGH